MKLLIALCFASLSAAQTVTVSDISTTPTQAVIHYRVTGWTAACTWQVSLSAGLTPLAYDVNGTLFSGSTSDSRSGAIVIPSTPDRYFVVGTRTSQVASDGNLYSRALQAASLYYYQGACNGVTVSGTFQTSNPELGNNFTEPPPFNASGYGNYAWPTINWTDQTQTYVDPQTGFAIKRVTQPGWYGQSRTGSTFAYAIDINSAWTNAQNILSGTTGSVASYSGSSADPIFVAFDSAQVIGNGIALNTWNPVETLDNILIRIFGTGTGTIAGCVSIDSGATCISPTETFVALPSSGGNPAGTYPTNCASDLSTGCFPNNGIWGGWSVVPNIGQMYLTSGTVNVAGTTVTAASVGTFSLNWKSGGKLHITGSSCPNSLCTIASVNTSQSITLTTSGGTLTGAAFKTANIGVKLWVVASSGSAAISVNMDHAYSDTFTGAEGQTPQCSPNPTTVSYAANGTSPIPPIAGQLCLAAHIEGQTQVLYLLIPSTGETRLLSPIWYVNSSDATQDQIADPVANNLSPIVGGFDATDPNTFYARAGTNGGTAIFKAVYDSATYHYKAYPHSLYPSATAGFTPGEDTTGAFYRGPAWSDTGITWTNLDKASLGLTLDVQIAAADSNYSAGLFNGATVTGANAGVAVSVNYPISNINPESITLIHTFNLSTGLLGQTANTWTSFPDRWCAMHSSEAILGWFGLICNPLSGQSGFMGDSGVTGYGPWQLTPTAVFKSGSFTADTSMTTGAPLDTCPTIPSNLTSLVPSNPHCVTFKSEMACSLTPITGEAAKWPCEYNPGFSELQPLAAGDGIVVNNNTGSPETLLIVSVTSLGSSSYQFTAIRASTPNVGLASAPNGWTGYAIPPGTPCGLPSCTPGTGFWFNIGSGPITWLLDPGAFAQHSDLGNAPTPGSNNYCLSSMCRYNVPFASQIGSFATANSFGSGTFQGVSAGPLALQGYPSVHQLTAPSTEQVWMANFNHLNPSFGSGPEVLSQVGAVTYSLVGGTSTVYEFTAINGTLSYKNLPPVFYAGPNVLQDISSPVTGNIITDATPWKACVALNANECRAGSSSGQVYVSVPQASTNAQCISNWYADNYPCAYTPPTKATYIIQQGIYANDPAGINWRAVTEGFMGPGRQFQFGSAIPDPTGQRLFFAGNWVNGVRQDLFAVQMPLWPNPQDQSTNRSQFVTVPIQIGGNSGLPKVRVRFGYAENGAASSYYCTPRADTCIANGSPFAYNSASPAWVACSSGCTVSIPAIPGRVLYYSVDYQDGGGGTHLGFAQVQAVL